MAIALIGDFKRFLSLCLLHLEHPVLKEFSVREGRVKFPAPGETEEGFELFCPTCQLRINLSMLCERPYLVSRALQTRSEDSLDWALQWGTHWVGNPMFSSGNAWFESPSEAGTEHISPKAYIPYKWLVVLLVLFAKLSHYGEIGTYRVRWWQSGVSSM